MGEVAAAVKHEEQTKHKRNIKGMKYVQKQKVNSDQLLVSC